MYGSNDALPPWDVVLAGWQLGEINPEDLPDLAVRALEKGDSAPTLGVIAGMREPTRSEIDDLMPSLRRDLGLATFTTSQALKLVLDNCLRRIASGEADPFVGARDVMGRVSSVDPVGADEILSSQILPFEEWVSAMEDDYNSVTWKEECAREIRNAAEQLVDLGGFRVPGDLSRPA